MNKNILVVSNSCFSKTDSNGKTLSDLFQSISPQKIYQFYVYGTPNFEICQNYYKISDKDALKSIFLKKYGKIISKKNTMPSDITPNALPSRRIKKTPLLQLFREIVWSLCLLNNTKLDKWVETIKPDIIFLNAADSSFILKIAKKISIKFEIPIILYSTENYCFKKYNYMTKRKSFFYDIFHYFLIKNYEQIQKYTFLGIFNTIFLEKKYKEKFNFTTTTLMSSTTLEFKAKKKATNKKNIMVSYLGNLGLNRHIPLIDIAEALSLLKPEYVLNVYGKVNSKKILNLLKSHDNIIYHGFVDAEKVKQVIYKSDLLIHAEFSSDFYNKDLEYVFSTKIADSISSGTPLLLYSNKNLACSKFIIDTQCAFYVSEKKDLKKVLNMALFNIDKRKIVGENALRVSREYFLESKNRLKTILLEM